MIHGMNDITGKGWVAGIIAWIAMMAYTINQSACLKTSSCDGSDLFFAAIFGLAILAPSWFVAYLVSDIFRK